MISQVSAVHITISLNVTLIFPIAFNKLVSCVVTAANIDAKTIKVKGVSAGAHLEYLGIISTKIGATSNNPANEGNTRRHIKNTDLLRDLSSCDLSPCILENAGKVTL